MKRYFQKCLLIDPPFPERPWDINWITQFPPKGLMYIAAFLRQNGINVEVFDTKIMQFERPSLLRRSLQEIQYRVENKIRDTEPVLIGITSTTISYLTAVQLAKSAKAAAPGAIVVIGGVHVNFTSRETLQECPWIDVVVLGEGEKPMLALAQGIALEEIQGISYWRGSEIIENPIGEPLAADDIPVPAYDLLNMRNYSYVVLVCSRGCFHECSFCELPSMHDRKMRLRPVEKVIAELDLALSLNPNLEIRYEDEFMGLHKERTSQILSAIASRRVGQFRASCRPDWIDSEVIDLLKAAGCTNVYIGMESGSNDVLRINKRGYGADRIPIIAELFRENDMLFHGSFILGLPGETLESMKLTLDAALLCCDATFSVVKKRFDELIQMMPYRLIVENSRAEFNVFTPNPGTLAYRRPEEMRYRLLHKNWELYDCSTSVGEPYDVSAAEIDDFKTKSFLAIQERMRDHGLPVKWWAIGYKG